jgi:hypothetical protein
MEILTPFLLFILIAFAPFVALNAYILVWLIGPAIRRAARCWEEGRQRASDDHRGTLQTVYTRGVNDALGVSPVRNPGATQLIDQKMTAPQGQPKRYTITGREVR